MAPSTIGHLMTQLSPSHFRVAFLGFSDFERHSLTTYFRLATHREPRYEPVHNVTDADFLVADADHGPSVQLVQVTERGAETVFIGAQRPAGALKWMARPIDALHVMRELDSLSTRPALAPPTLQIDTSGETLTFIEVAQQMLVPPRRDAPAPEDLTSDLPSAPELPEAAPDVAPGVAPPRRATPAAPAAPAAGAAKARMPPRPAAAPPPRRAVAPASPLLTRAPVPVGPPPPPRALLVDDSEIALRFLESRLKPWGLQTDRATHSTKALELLGRRDYDYVFLDLELGPDSELDGLGLCQQIKQMTSSLQSTVVMVSAHHSELDRARGNLAGCDAYLGKPLVEADLSRLLKRGGLKPPPPPAPKPDFNAE